MTASSQIPVSQQGVSFHFMALVFVAIILLAIAAWLTANTGTSSSVTATTATAVTTFAAAAEAEAIANALQETGEIAFPLIESYVLRYNPPPTTDELNKSLESLAEKIEEFTSKKWMKVNKHHCSTRASWALVVEKKKKDVEILHFEWDSQHNPGEIEVYSPGKGKAKIHLGSINIGPDVPNKPGKKNRIASCDCK